MLPNILMMKKNRLIYTKKSDRNWLKYQYDDNDNVIYEESKYGILASLFDETNYKIDSKVFTGPSKKEDYLNYKKVYWDEFYQNNKSFVKSTLVKYGEIDTRIIINALIKNNLTVGVNSINIEKPNEWSYDVNILKNTSIDWVNIDMTINPQLGNDNELLWKNL